ncbi:MAG: hypothetical protein QXH21_09870 [Ignisphaera sp.]
MVNRSKEIETIADAVIRTLVVKIKAMETLDKGILSDTGVTTLDRVLIIIGSLNPKFYRRFLSTEPREEDIAKVFKIAQDTGVWKEEVVLLAMVRRLVIESLEKGVAKLSDLFDVSEEEDDKNKTKAITVS